MTDHLLARSSSSDQPGDVALLGRWPRPAPRLAAVGTMHGKEVVLAPILGQLGLRCVAPVGLDTDRYGTFTREVARDGAPLHAARRKAHDAAELLDAPVGVGSEGSFGPHPSLPWVARNIELVVLVDLEAGLEIVGRSATTDVVAGQARVTSIDEAVDAAVRCGFPEHAVVVRSSPDDLDGIVKGIRDVDSLRREVRLQLARNGVACLETDLRAHVHPTRRTNIRRAARELVEAARRRCPRCDRPGFGVDRYEPGLPCLVCATPTTEVRAEVRRCDGCDHEHHVRAPLDADPAACPRCNP